MTLRKQTALVTGASRGIGRAIALSLAQEGVGVGLVARNEKDLHALAQECRAFDVPCAVLPCDLTRPESCGKVVHDAVRELGSLSYLVNNAGLYERAAAQDADLAAWDRVMALNVQALIHLTRHALPHLMEAPKKAVVNIASVSGREGHRQGGIYCASKHAVMGYTKCLFEDVREQGVKVCAICPGFVETDMVQDRGLALQKTIAPEDVAAAVVYVLRQSDRVCPTEIVLRPQYSPYPAGR